MHITGRIFYIYLDKLQISLSLGLRCHAVCVINHWSMCSICFTGKLHTHSLVGRLRSRITWQLDIKSLRLIWFEIKGTEASFALENISRHSSFILHYCTCDFPESNAWSSLIVRSKRLEADLVGGTDDRNEKRKNKQCYVYSMCVRIFMCVASLILKGRPPTD